jgi:hypothetical protein
MKYTALLCACLFSFWGCGEEETTTVDPSMVNMMTGGSMSMLPIGGTMMTPGMSGTMMMMPTGGSMTDGGNNIPDGNNMPGGTNMSGGNNMTPPAPVPMTPAQNCGELLNCLSSCNQNDMACQQTCFETATPNALSEYDALDMCASSSGCMGDDIQCIQMNCASQVSACTPQGTQYQNCAEAISCIRRCPQGDTGCQNNCLNSSTRQAQQEYSNLSMCAQTAGCMGNDIQCIDMNCGTEFDLCTPQGTNSCAGILQCIGSCTSNDPTCGISCIESGNLDAQDRFIAIEECLVEECPNTSDQMCIQAAVGPQGACSSYLAECQSN